jgi:AraC-like DNA-binding protein
MLDLPNWSDVMSKSRKLSIILRNRVEKTPVIKTPDWYIRPYRKIGEWLWSEPNKLFEGVIVGYEQVVVNENSAESAIFYPETCTALTFYCGPGPPSSYFTGPMTKPIPFSDVKSGTYFVIIFSPSKMFPFVPVPLMELCNHWVPTSSILSSQLNILSELLSKVTSFHEKVRIWESHFLHSWWNQIENNPLWINQLLVIISKNPTFFSEKQMAKITGYSVRHTRELFKRYVDITPTEFQRISRYKLSVFKLATKPKTDFTELACDLGFFDQAHFIHEFNHFHGSTPSRFVKEYILPTIQNNK